MQTFDLQISQNDTYSTNISVTNCSGMPIDLTSYTTSGFLKYQYSDITGLLNLNPKIQSPSQSGIINITIPSSGTASLPVTIGVYNVHIIDPSGNATKILRGLANIYPSV